MSRSSASRAANKAVTVLNVEITSNSNCTNSTEPVLERNATMERIRKESAILSQSHLHLHGQLVQAFGTVRLFPLGLSYDERAHSCERLNLILADTQTIYALYKKHHRLMRGPNFHQLHLMLDKHAREQLALVDAIAERVQMLGGIAVGDPRHTAEITRIQRPPNGCEEVAAMLSRLLDAHEIILSDAREAASRIAQHGDDGTNNLIVSQVIRTNELQVWFLAEHVVDVRWDHAL